MSNGAGKDRGESRVRKPICDFLPMVNVALRRLSGVAEKLSQAVGLWPESDRGVDPH